MTGRVLSAVHGARCFLRFEGTVRFMVGNRLEKYVRGLFATSKVGHVFIDLTSAEHLDSTILGILARISRYQQNRNASRPTIFCSKDDIRLLLDTMGFDEVFEIRDESPGGIWPEDMGEIPETEPSVQEKAGTILRAHKELMGMGDGNRELFRGAVEELEREMKGRKRAGGED